MSRVYLGTHDFTGATVSGAGGGFASWKTIGSGGDYSDVNAFAAANTGQVGLLIGDIAEDSAIAVPTNGLQLYLGGYTLTMGTNNQFTFAQQSNVNVYGPGEIVFEKTSGSGELFDVGGFTSSIITLKDFTFDNNSTLTNCHITQGIIRADNLRVECPNTSNGGINIKVDGSYASNCEIVGGGSSCTAGITIDSGDQGIASNIALSGSWKNPGVNDVAINLQNFGKLYNLDVNTSSDFGIAIATQGGIFGITNLSQTVQIYFKGSKAFLANADLIAGNIDLQANDENFISNVRTTGAPDLSDSGANNNLFTNCHFEGSITVAGDGNKMSNSVSEGAITVNDGAVINSFNALQVGPVAGGGASTITDNNSANNTIITGCATDAALAGTGTPVATGNVVY